MSGFFRSAAKNTTFNSPNKTKNIFMNGPKVAFFGEKTQAIILSIISCPSLVAVNLMIY